MVAQLQESFQSPVPSETPAERDERIVNEIDNYAAFINRDLTEDQLRDGDRDNYQLTTPLGPVTQLRVVPSGIDPASRPAIQGGSGEHRTGDALGVQGHEPVEIDTSAKYADSRAIGNAILSGIDLRVLSPTFGRQRPTPTDNLATYHSRIGHY